MKEILRLLDDPETTIAIVGSTDNRDKFGNIIYRDLKSKGYALYPVNPNRKTVENDPAYPTLADLPSKPTLVNFVIPPPETLNVLRQCLDLDLKDVFVQPGAEDAEVLAFLEEQYFNYVANDCIMVQTRGKKF